jgi:hypothetical protein
MCRAKKTRLGDDLQTIVYRRRIFQKLRLEVPDVALDQHTARGRRMGRSWDHWKKEGLKLTNEIEGMNPYAANAMALRKAYGKLPKKDRTLPKGRKTESYSRKKIRAIARLTLKVIARPIRKPTRASAPKRWASRSNSRPTNLLTLSLGRAVALPNPLP